MRRTLLFVHTRLVFDSRFEDKLLKSQDTHDIVEIVALPFAELHHTVERTPPRYNYAVFFPYVNHAEGLGEGSRVLGIAVKCVIFLLFAYYASCHDISPWEALGLHILSR